ncbi:hypothetical protein PCH_Pc22g05930 [Penicillium rubens Wisconsin 54-1255]|uniref:Uncharacterized protein n=1 Tax=Penicillium rubens (strain ATCC 28089 / DSM 1075 / NRRL 1951 / Wisconsin 54-1255) TaxID=500485 RepID=B6HVI1_PENRW|nr:hypothetical protein PCH_Pc22g05930 [Penicillium rubens Wisconsin 54-1255]
MGRANLALPRIIGDPTAASRSDRQVDTNWEKDIIHAVNKSLDARTETPQSNYMFATWLAESHKEGEIERSISPENGCSTVSSQSSWNNEGQDGKNERQGDAKR